MSQFSYTDYQKAVSAAQNRSSNVKIGWFKLANDQDEALVRINISSINDLQFATIHQLGASTKWMKVSCLNEFGSVENTCPLCAAVAAGNTAIGKASKRVYVPMLVSYKDRTTGQWTAPQPVIWDKPAGFSREIANKIQTYGDLRQCMFKITRNGAKGDMQTTYPMDYAVPAVFKPEMIPADFSAFDNFKLDKHSFWVKSAEDVNTFLATGAFPEYVKPEAPTTVVAQVAQTYASTTPAVNTTTTSAPAAQVDVPPFDGPYTNTAPATPEAPVAPTKTFNSFTF